MRVDRIEHAQGEGANGRRWRRADHVLLQRASDDGVAGGGQQIALVGDVPVNGAGTGGELFGQGAERQTIFSAAVQEPDRRLNDALP